MYMYMHIPLISSSSSSDSSRTSMGGVDVGAGGTDENNNSLHFGLIN